MRRAKRTAFEMLKLGKEKERCRGALELTEKQGHGRKHVQDTHTRLQVCEREVTRARGEAESAKEALLEWIKKEAECRI